MAEDNGTQENDDYGYSTREKKGVIHFDEFLQSLLNFRERLESWGIQNPQISFAVHPKGVVGEQSKYIHDVSDTRIGILDPNCDDRVIVDVFEKHEKKETTDEEH